MWEGEGWEGWAGRVGEAEGRRGYYCLQVEAHGHGGEHPRMCQSLCTKRDTDCSGGPCLHPQRGLRVPSAAAVAADMQRVDALVGGAR